MSRSVISEGIRELTGERLLPAGRVRRAGAGRKLLKAIDTSLLENLRTLVESSAMGDPESPLLWTTQSLRTLADHLKAKGHKIGHVTVGADQASFKLLILRRVYPLKPSIPMTTGSFKADS